MFETLSEVVFELVLPCLAGTFALSGHVSSFHPVSVQGAETESCVNAENDVLHGTFVVGSSSSCIDPVCSSSTGFWGKDTEGKAEDVKLVQFFVNRGKGSTSVVRCSSDTVLSEVLHLADDEYALCGWRFEKVGCTIGELFFGNCSNVQVLRRLRGGAGLHLDIPGQWECKVCKMGSTRLRGGAGNSSAVDYRWTRRTS